MGPVASLRFPHTKRAKKDIASALESFQKSQVTFDMVQVAALECSCEFRRPLTRLTEDILPEIVMLHKKKWQTLSTFTIEQAKQESSVNTVLKLPSIKFSSRRPQSFKEIQVEYLIPEHVIAITQH